MHELRRCSGGVARGLAAFWSGILVALAAGCASVVPHGGEPAGGVAPISVAPASDALLRRGEPPGPQPLANAPSAETLAEIAARTPLPPRLADFQAAYNAPVAPGANAAAPAPRFNSLWDRIRAGFAMPPLDTPLVAEKERFYLERPDYLQRMFSRGSRYLHHIVEEIERRGLPTELALLPFVESAMNPVALSSANAAGLWQFIPSTGKAYDLQQNWWVDNRRDVVKSTDAALEYLVKIHAMHGNDWFLALASYNWGEGAVSRAVKRNQARGKPADYLSLDMPNETRHYVPKLIALKNILARADELGVALPELPDRPYFVTVEKTRPIDLKLAAKFAGMSVEEFVALNPAHNRPVIAASRNNELKIPADRVESFLAAIDKHEEANKTFASWQPYTLKRGETIESVASRTRVTAAELRSANGLKPRQRILAGTRILVPHAEVEDESKVEKFAGARVYESVDRPAIYHTVRAKESLPRIAARYGVSAATLAAWNGLKEGVKRGMRLLVRPASTQTVLTDEGGRKSVVATTENRRTVKVNAKRSSAKRRPSASSPIRRVRGKPVSAPRKRPTS